MKKILLVDDSSLIRAVLKNFTKRDNITIIEASEGKEAIEKYKAETPDLIFMDIIMPNGMDGISAAKEIKKINPNANIVMCTSVREDKEFNEAKNIGVEDYLNKPFSKEEISKIIDKYLGGN
ncbi:hypothetical protein C0585_05920 [Candidatus Woesearchaeota archaeon]|nr:MAG: hypothetical protein C0585_05920 [Candidatus Woesearchaeota archaeon]